MCLIVCLDPENFKKFKLVERKQLSHNVAEFKFALPTPTSVLGLPIGQHISCRFSSLTWYFHWFFEFIIRNAYNLFLFVRSYLVLNTNIILLFVKTIISLSVKQRQGQPR